MNIKLFESTSVLLCVCLYVSGGVEDWSDFNIYFKKIVMDFKTLVILHNEQPKK